MARKWAEREPVADAELERLDRLAAAGAERVVVGKAWAVEAVVGSPNG